MRVRGWRRRLVIKTQMESDMTEMCEQRKRRRWTRIDVANEIMKHRLSYCGLFVLFNIVAPIFLTLFFPTCKAIFFLSPQIMDMLLIWVLIWSPCVCLPWADRSTNVWSVVCLQCCSPAVSDDQQRLGGHKGNRQHGGAGRWTKPVRVLSPTGLPPRNSSLLAQDHQRPTGQVQIHPAPPLHARTHTHTHTLCSFVSLLSCVHYVS